MRYLLEQLNHLAHKHPDTIGFQMGLDADKYLTYAQCYRQAQSIADTLSKQYQARSCIILALENSLDFIITFLGCIYADMIPIPAQPLNMHIRHLATAIAKLEWIAQDSAAVLLCGDQTTLSALSNLSEDLQQEVRALNNEHTSFDSLSILNIAKSSVPALHNDQAASYSTPKPNAIAYLQYTSGSTGPSKGVMISHSNISANTKAISPLLNNIETYVNWLPLYHDLGIMSILFMPLISATKSIILTPYDFLVNPLSWLQSIQHHPHCCSSLPNFALEWCCAKIHEQDCVNLNLTSCEKLLCGAEKNQVASFQQFYKKFKHYGLRNTALSACYGLAEHTLCVVCYYKEKPCIDNATIFNLNDLSQGIVTTAKDSQSALTLLGHGAPIDEHQIKIVDPDSLQLCPNNRVGEIWCQGPSVALGYWHNEHATKQIFDAHTKDGAGPYLRTGDLGFFYANELYIYGRCKDTLIIRGCNYAASDIEWVAQGSHSSIRPGNVCALTDDLSQKEQSILLVELRPNTNTTPQAIITAINKALNNKMGISIDTIVLLPPQTLSKTSSGKLQRQQNKKRHYTNQLKLLAIMKNPDQLQYQADPQLLRKFFKQ